MPKKRKAITRALPPSTAPPQVARHRPVTETVVIHTERKKTRNADGGGSLIGKGAALPIIAGVAGGAATVYATSKLNWHPVAVAGAGAAAGLAVAATAKKPWVKQVGMGAAIGAATLGGVQLVGSLLAPKPTQAQAQPGKPKRAADGDQREAEGDGLVTRKELNDALSKIANVQKEGQKQQTCDLMSALRDEIKKVLAEGPSGAPAPPAPQPRPPMQTQSAAAFTYPFVRAADGDDYARNAYGDFDERNAYGEDEYTRNAYGDFDQRDADPDVYRDAYGDEYRDAYGDDDYARNAYGDEYRDSGGDEYRDAYGDEERNAFADPELYRDAYGDEYRDAYGDEERNAYGEELQAA